MQIIKPRCEPVEKIYAGLAAEAEREVRNFRKPAKRFRASEVADCRRKIWYRVGGFVPVPSEPWLKLVGDSGGMHHDYLRYIAKHFGVPMQGVTFSDDGQQKEDKYIVREYRHHGQSFKMSARSDFVTQLEIDEPETGLVQEVDAVVEVKSLSFFDHDSMQRAWKKDGHKGVQKVMQETKRSFMWQGNATAMLKGIDYVHVMLVGRGGNNIGLTTAGRTPAGKWEPLAGERTGGLTWRVEEKDKDNILTKMADIARHLDNGEPPSPDHTNGSKACNQCAWWVYCHGADRKAKYPIKGVL